VEGEPAEVDEAGRFAVRRPRRSGGAVRVAAVDPAGRLTERRVACRGDDWHPVSDLTVRWGHARRP
jgi:hypothetical protein